MASGTPTIAPIKQTNKQNSLGPVDSVFKKKNSKHFLKANAQ